MEFKGTKDGWVKSGKNGIHTKDGACIAITYGDNAEPNALLISKAPEMLEMLKLVSDGISEMDFAQLELMLPEIEQLIKSATEL